jgi:LPXTG-site transpeptidase (sortase) family protein
MKPNNQLYGNKIINYSIWLSRLNSFLTLLIFIGCGYILITPFLASINTRVKSLQDTTGGLVYETKLADEFKVDKTQLKPIPEDNRLVIPKIFVDGPITEGDTKDALNTGYWKRTTALPGGSDNIVIAGHRNLWKWTLFDLDKLTEGDLITLYWDKVEYNYKVSKTFEVTPSAIEIEAPTNTEQLTIYTCTPVLTATNRLVIVALPFNK